MALRLVHIQLGRRRVPIITHISFGLRRAIHRFFLVERTVSPHVNNVNNVCVLRGAVHSFETPTASRACSSGQVSGLGCWVAFLVALWVTPVVLCFSVGATLPALFQSCLRSVLVAPSCDPAFNVILFFLGLPVRSPFSLRGRRYILFALPRTLYILQSLCCLWSPFCWVAVLVAPSCDHA